jgi:hypothetical protein
MWVKQPELIIPGATGVTSSNQIQTAKGVWATGQDYVNGDVVCVLGTSVQSGVQTDSDDGFIDDNNQDWMNHYWADFALKITSGTGSGQIRYIYDSGNTRLKIRGGWSPGLDTSSYFSIYPTNSYVCVGNHHSGTFTTDLSSYWRITPWIGVANDLITPTVKHFSDCLTNCEALVYTGYSDWRAPNLFEQISLFYFNDVSCIDSNYFPNCMYSYYTLYWTSTINTNNSNNKVVDFNQGFVSESWGEGSYNYIRPVRGGD